MSELTTPAMPVEPCGLVSGCMAHPASYRDQARPRWTSVDPSKKQVAEFAIRALEAVRTKDVARHETNLPALEHNKVIRAHIIATMKAAGIPDGWTRRDTKSRSRFPKSIREDRWLSRRLGAERQDR